MLDKMMSVFGVIAFLSLAWTLSSNRKRINLRLVVVALFLQVSLGILCLGIPALNWAAPLQFFFQAVSRGVVSILDYTHEGSKFVFGSLTDSTQFGFIFAVQVLPTIIFMAALVSVLYHLGVMQLIVKGIAVVMQKALGTSGAETLAVSASIFVGQTEAPLLIKPFIAKKTQSELFTVMVAGMAHVAGGVLAAYTGLLKDSVPGIAGHLLTASIMAAPGSILISKMLQPEVEVPETLGQLPKQSAERAHSNVIEAASGGASEGLGLALNVLGMLLAFTALIALINGILGWIGTPLGINPSQPLSLQMILGYMFSPFAWLMGIPWDECVKAGALLGQKTVLNEFVAYLELAQKPEAFSERTRVILSYALCGFANFSSIAIQIGGIGGLAPERKKDIARMGLRAVLGGTLVSFITATIAGLLL